MNEKQNENQIVYVEYWVEFPSGKRITSQVNFVTLDKANLYCEEVSYFFQFRNLMSSFYIYSTTVCEYGSIQKADLINEFHSKSNLR
jgi:hypothetical protein